VQSSGQPELVIRKDLKSFIFGKSGKEYIVTGKKSHRRGYYTVRVEDVLEWRAAEKATTVCARGKCPAKHVGSGGAMLAPDIDLTTGDSRVVAFPSAFADRRPSRSGIAAEELLSCSLGRLPLLRCCPDHARER